jgi:hypothetical protein
MAAWIARSHWRTRPVHLKGDRMRSLGAAGAAIALCLALGGAQAAAQDSPVTEDVLFEVVVPASAVPDPFYALYFEGQTLDPGVDGVIGAGVENMRGRTLYVDAGELVIEPMADALLWRQEATISGFPEDVPAGASVSLAAGDLILLPAIPPDQLDPEAVIGIANPGTEIAVTYGFHMCSGGGAPSFPEGMRDIRPGGGVKTGGKATAPLASEDAVVRLTRTTLEPGATAGLDEDALFALHRLESGTIDVSFTSTVNDKTFIWSWEPGGVLPSRVGKTDWELRASSDTPASMLTLSGVERPASPE